MDESVQRDNKDSIVVVDQFFTPDKIASDTLSAYTKGDCKLVADFAVGDGSLLKAVPFKAERVIGLDLDRNVINKLRKNHPDWALCVGNFIEPSKTTYKWLSQFLCKIDLILLNPPFSYRGGAFHNINIDGFNLRCRPALSFVITALKYLNDTGTLVAILPLSCMKSEGDLAVFEWIERKYEIKSGIKLNRNTFKNCSPQSVVISIKHRKNKQIGFEDKNNLLAVRMSAQMLRGTYQMFKTLNNGKYQILHTTSIKQGQLDIKCFRYCNVPSTTVTGYFICVPRVGAPKREKIAFVETKLKYVLSDCIIALQADNIEHTKNLKSLIIDNWKEFSSLYESTCAPYITLKQLSNFFIKFGVGLTKVQGTFDFKEVKEPIPLSNCKISISAQKSVIVAS